MSSAVVAVEAVSYEVSAYPFHDATGYRELFTLTVERRGDDSWAVMRRGACWNRRTKTWDYEPLPSSRTDAFKRTHRFPLDQALTIAREQAPLITVNGWARDVEDARLLLDMLGLVVDGVLVSDLVTVVAAAGLDGGRPTVVREPPPRRDTVPEGLRNLPPAPPPTPTRKHRYSLTEDLEELERTDPAVAAAAASYDRMVERVTSKHLPKPDKDDTVTKSSARKTAAPPPVDMLACGLEHPSARVRKLARTASAAVDELVTALLAASR